MPTKKQTRAKAKRKPQAVEKRGRKTLLTPEAMTEIEECLILGSSHKTAITLAGISKATFYGWINRGQDAENKQDSGEPVAEKEKLYLDFLNRVKKAIEKGKKRHLSIINSVAQGGQEYKTTDFYNKDGEVIKTVTEKAPPNFYASAWILERRYPDEFALKGRQPGEGDGNQTVNIQNNIKVELTNANAGTVLDILAECGAIPAPARGVEREAEVE